MKKTVRIRLTYLIPFIFTGLCLLGVVGAVEIAERYSFVAEGLRILRYWGAAATVLAFVVSSVISFKFIRPLESFIKKTENMPVVLAGSGINPHEDEAVRYAQVMSQVADILSELEARELFPSVVGNSEAMRGVLAQLQKAALADIPVMFTGGRGVGKSLLVQTLYENSVRRGNPFIRVNCAVVPEAFFEKDLFGFEEGRKVKAGRLELADKGILYLDEVSHLPERVQLRMLEFLKEGRFERVDGRELVKANVLVITSSLLPCSDLTANGFNAELAEMLSVFPIHVPDLSEREDDIPLLVQNHLKRNNANVTVSPAAMRHLLSHNWPGNVSELGNTLDRAVAVCDGVIEPEHLPGVGTVSEASIKFPLPEGLDAYMAQSEAVVICQALERTGGVQTRAARLLGIKDRSLWHRLKKYGIEAREFKDHNE